MAKNTGKGSRIGAVRQRSQVFNPPYEDVDQARSGRRVHGPEG